MRALVLRPFGIKNGIDFDSVDRDLIAPALASLYVSSTTFPEISDGGNTRPDFLELLITSDLMGCAISEPSSCVRQPASRASA